MSEDSQVVKTVMTGGFPIGFVDKGQAYVNNHVNINLHYHKVEEDSYHIVKFLVEPFSIKHELKDAGEDLDVDDDIKIINPIASCLEYSTQNTTWVMIEGRSEPQPASERILYTYDVIWIESDVNFADRWNDYLAIRNNTHNHSRWISIVNTLLLALIFSALIVALVMRTLRSRSFGIEKTETEESDMIATIHSPAMLTLLATACGTGVQFVLTAFTVILFGALGFVSIVNRGQLVTMAIVVFHIFGFINGYITTWMCTRFKCKWVEATI